MTLLLVVARCSLPAAHCFARLVAAVVALSFDRIALSLCSKVELSSLSSWTHCIRIPLVPRATRERATTALANTWPAAAQRACNTQHPKGIQTDEPALNTR